MAEMSNDRELYDNRCFNRNYASQNPGICGLQASVINSCLEKLFIGEYDRIVNPCYVEDEGKGEEEQFQFESLNGKQYSRGYDVPFALPGLNLRDSEYFPGRSWEDDREGALPGFKDPSLLIGKELLENLMIVPEDHIINPFFPNNVNFRFEELSSRAMEVDYTTPKSRKKLTGSYKQRQPVVELTSSPLSEAQQDLMPILNSLKIEPNERIQKIPMRITFQDLEEPMPVGIVFGAPGLGASAQHNLGSRHPREGTRNLTEIINIPCEYPSRLVYPEIKKRYQDIINTNYVVNRQNIYNMVMPGGEHFKNDYTNQKCINEKLCNYPRGYPELESPLRNKTEKGGIMNACYLNALLHFLYPVLLNIRYLTNENLRMSELSSFRIDNDYKNIVQFMINELNKERTKVTGYVGTEDEGVFTTIRSFLQVLIHFNNSGELKITNYPESFKRGIDCDSFEALQRISNNLSLLGYCTKNSLTGLVFGDFYRDRTDYRTEMFNINVNSDYNLQDIINREIFLNQSTSGKQLINIGNWLPLFVIINIRSYSPVKEGERNNQSRPIRTFPSSFDNIEIYGTQYEITDMIYYDFVHYVSFNKRIKNQTVHWYYFNDLHYPNVPVYTYPEIKSFKSFYPCLYLLKKVPPT